MTPIDLIVMVLVIAVLQAPLMYSLHLKDQEIQRLQRGLLRKEDPVLAARVEVEPRPAPTQEERQEASRLRKLKRDMYKP